MGTRHWPEDAEERVAELEAEVERLRCELRETRLKRDDHKAEYDTARMVNDQLRTEVGRLGKALDAKISAVNTPCGDAIEWLWNKVSPGYEWEYPGQAARHLWAIFEEKEANIDRALKLVAEQLDERTIIQMADVRPTLEAIKAELTGAGKEDKLDV